MALQCMFKAMWEAGLCKLTQNHPGCYGAVHRCKGRLDEPATDKPHQECQPCTWSFRYLDRCR